MRWLVAVFLALMSSQAAAQCVPSNAPPTSPGCWPQASSILGTDYVMLWRPSAFPGSATLGTVSELFQNVPATFPTLTVTGATTLNGGTFNGTYAGSPTFSGGPYIPIIRQSNNDLSPYSINVTGSTDNQLNFGYYYNLQFTGTNTVSPSLSLNQVTIGESVSAPNATVDGLDWLHYFGVGVQGNRGGVGFQLKQTATTANTGGTGGAYVAFSATALATANDNGISLTPSGARGGFFASNLYASLTSTATYWGTLVGQEIDMAVCSACSVLHEVGEQIVKTTIDATKPALTNTTYLVANQSGATAWEHVFQVGWDWAMTSTDSGTTIFGSQLDSNANGQAEFGLDLLYTALPAFSTTGVGGFLRSNQFGVDGAGAMQIGTAYFTPSSSGITIDTKGLVGTGTPTVSVGGSGCQLGDLLYYRDGIYKVATLSGSLVASVSVYTDNNSVARQPTYPSPTPPSNPVSTTAWTRNPACSGVTLTMSWNSSATTLAFGTNTSVVVRDALGVGSVGVISGYQFSVQQAGDGEAYFGSTGSNNAIVTIDDGAGAQQASLSLMDAGVLKWQIIKQGNNSFNIYDNVNSAAAFAVSTSGAVTVGESGKLTTIAGTLTITGAAIGPSLDASSTTLALGPTNATLVKVGNSLSDEVLGSGAFLPALNATVGFAHVPFTNASSGAGGIPTGTPANTSGPACIWNDVTFILNCYSPSAGAWKHVAFTANAG